MEGSSFSGLFDRVKGSHLSVGVRAQKFLGPSSCFIPWKLSHRILQVLTHKARRGERDRTCPEHRWPLSQGWSKGVLLGVHQEVDMGRPSIHKMVRSQLDYTLHHANMGLTRMQKVVVQKRGSTRPCEWGRIPTAALTLWLSRGSCGKRGNSPP